MSPYLFTSERLGFRNWNDSDLNRMQEINADEQVMEFFPSIATPSETQAFIQRMQRHYEEKRYCYFAVDKLEDESCIGFIGLGDQTYAADFTPCVDIGWRISHREWHKGYATEGAQRCLDYAFTILNMERVYAVAPKINLRSEQVMIRIGMEKWGEFDHPKLSDHPRLQKCIVYAAHQSRHGMR
jgi:RimJ/RimL family protein N-acetyltransferase